MTLPCPGAAPARTAHPASDSTKLPAPSSSLDVRRTLRNNPGQVRPVAEPFSSSAPDAQAVITRLEEAGQTLLCLPHTGPTTALRQTRHQYVARALEAYTSADAPRLRLPVPPAGTITRMDQALAWITLIPRERLVLRRIVGCRCLISPLSGRHLFSWRQLARTLGADHKAIQRWHATGIDLIVAALNQDASPAPAQDMLG